MDKSLGMSKEEESELKNKILMLNSIYKHFNNNISDLLVSNFLEPK